MCAFQTTAASAHGGRTAIEPGCVSAPERAVCRAVVRRMVIEHSLTEGNIQRVNMLTSWTLPDKISFPMMHPAAVFLRDDAGAPVLK